MLSPEAQSLKKRVLGAGAWSLTSYGFNYAFRLGSNLIMTRLLLPDAFGLMSIATLVSVGLSLLSDFGLKPSVVQSKRGHEPLFLNTAWVVQIWRGVILCLCMLAVALAFKLADGLALISSASVYADPRLPYLLAALSLASVIGGFQSTKSFQASRDLRLSGLTKIEIVSQMTGFAVMIAWATLDRSIWALVSGSLSSTVTRTLLTHIWLPGVSNSFQWDKSAHQEIIKFGKWIFLSSALYFVAANGDRMVLGAILDPTTLGLYSIAFLIFNSIDQFLGVMISEVSFPALSEVSRNNRKNLRSAYYRFHTVIASVAYFAAGALMISAETIVSLLYDSRYHSAGWMLQVLAVALLAQPFRMATQTFLALGLSRTYFQLNAIRIVVLFVALPLGYRLGGTSGAVWGIVSSHFSSLPLVIYHAKAVGLMDLRKEILPLPGLLFGVIFGTIFNLVLVGLVSAAN